MTLSTQVYVLDRVTPEDVRAECNRLLGSPDAKPSDPWDWGNGVACIGNAPSQGLDAWLLIRHRGDAPLRDVARTDTEVPCWLVVDFDTAYGYMGPDGEGCGELHAKLVARLGRWLDSRGLRWKWRNEFTGEVFTGYDGLETLGGEALKARNWLNTEVLPAIRAAAGDPQP